MKEEIKDKEILLRPKAGLPKHGTRWARAQNPMLRELSREERTAPL